MPPKSSFGLGRGLEALIPSKKVSDRPQSPSPVAVSQHDEPLSSSRSVASRHGTYREVPIDSVVPNPRQPRTLFDPEELQALSDSIKLHGLLQPLVVTQKTDGGYELVSGERRLRACKMAGFTTVPVLERTAEDIDKLQLAIIENIQRQDLNPIERAQSFRILIDEFSLTQEEAGERLGIARSVIANTLRYLDLPANAQDALIQGKITEGHAKIIASLPTEQEQQNVLETILNQHYTVRETETFVKAHRRHKTADIGTGNDVPTSADDVYTLSLLRDALATKVEIRHVGSGGALMVYFYSPEELRDITERISRAPLL